LGGFPRTNRMVNAEIGTPRADMAQTARDSRVAPQMCGRHKNGQSGRGNTGNSNPREEQPPAHGAKTATQSGIGAEIANARGGI
jgi:hypothetical protein